MNNVNILNAINGAQAQLLVSLAAALECGAIAPQEYAQALEALRNALRPVSCRLSQR